MCLRGLMAVLVHVRRCEILENLWLRLSPCFCFDCNHMGLLKHRPLGPHGPPQAQASRAAFLPTGVGL